MRRSFLIRQQRYPRRRTAPPPRERVLNAELDGRRYELKLHLPEPPHAELARRRRERVAAGAHHGAARDAVVSPMQGTVLAVEVADGDEVQPGQVLCVVEAMKMENEITAHRAGRVDRALRRGRAGGEDRPGDLRRPE